MCWVSCGVGVGVRVAPLLTVCLTCVTQLGDVPDADMKPPDDVLFVCKVCVMHWCHVCEALAVDIPPPLGVHL